MLGYRYRLLLANKQNSTMAIQTPPSTLKHSHSRGDSVALILIASSFVLRPPGTSGPDGPSVETTRRAKSQTNKSGRKLSHVDRIGWIGLGWGQQSAAGRSYKGSHEANSIVR